MYLIPLGEDLGPLMSLIIVLVATLIIGYFVIKRALDRETVRNLSFLFMMTILLAGIVIVVLLFQK